MTKYKVCDKCRCISELIKGFGYICSACGNVEPAQPPEPKRPPQGEVLGQMRMEGRGDETDTIQHSHGAGDFGEEQDADAASD